MRSLRYCLLGFFPLVVQWVVGVSLFEQVLSVHSSEKSHKVEFFIHFLVCQYSLGKVSITHIPFSKTGQITFSVSDLLNSCLICYLLICNQQSVKVRPQNFADVWYLLQWSLGKNLAWARSLIRLPHFNESEIFLIQLLRKISERFDRIVIIHVVVSRARWNFQTQLIRLKILKSNINEL